MAKIKVSIVEDLDEIRQGFSFLVNSSEQLECIACYSSAEEALKNLRKNTPHVIIMDIGLPGMTGIKCAKLIKKRYPSIQIMIFTIYEDDDRLFTALSAGASGYILKDTAPDKLIEAIIDLHAGGSPMSSQIARRVVLSLQHTVNARLNANNSELSLREKEILDLLAEGFRNKDISKKLFVSDHTVKSHIYHINEKLHVKSRIEALNKFFPGKKKK